ncbi:MAG: endonuclease/exonuclease/phosphatase family protein [bacterium]|nr:endonuclease/exonuclease/phosphatase family protein [bacterium]
MKKLITTFAVSLLLLITAIFPQDRVKILTYNILNYPNFSATKNTKYQEIFNEAKPDIIAVQEILSQYGVNLFLSDVLGNSFKAATFFDGPDTDNALFYKDSLLTLLSSNIITNTPRYITRYVLQHNFTQDILIIYVAHFKAGDTPSDEATREQEVARLRINTDQLSPGTNFIVVGDFNLYRASEPAYIRLLDQTSPGYFLDPVNRYGNWHANSNFADVHTQSTRTVQLTDGGSTGGLDDRFDFILVSQSLKSFGGVDYVDGTYWAYGNDGQHFNQQIVNPPYPISEQIAFALHDVSDHLPVVAEFDFGVVNDVETNIDPSLLTFNLYQNYPNPFNPSTKISFTIPPTASGEDQQVNLFCTILWEEK